MGKLRNIIMGAICDTGAESCPAQPQGGLARPITSTQGGKLTYFKLHAKGDPIRMLLSHAGVQYTDRAIGFDEWPALKATMPAGQVPLWEQDGKVYNQANAIIRMLGRQHGYYPQDDAMEAFNIDWALEAQADFWNTKNYRYIMSKTTEEEKITEISDNFAKFSAQIESKLTEHGQNYVAGNRLTIADFIVFSTFMGMPMNDYSECEEQTAIYQAIKAKIEGHTKVNEYVARMQTEMSAYLEARPKCYV